MATKSAGRVSIRVVPDSTGFRRDLKKSLDRIEKSLVAKIRAELFIDRESLLKLKKQIEALVVKLRPKIEIPTEDLEALKERIESLDPEVSVDLNTKEAAARMAALSRTRETTLFVRIREIGNNILSGTATRLGAMAGLNLTLDALREGSEFMNNIDRKAVQFAQTMSKIAAMAGTITTALGNLITIGADALNVGKLGLFAPAFLTSAGIGIGVLVAVLKDMGTVMADLKPRFANLQNAMSAKFWDQAGPKIRDFTNKYWPTLNDRLQQTSRNLGWVSRSFIAAVDEGLGVEKLNLMFDRFNDAIADSRPGIKAWTRSFIKIGEVGTRFFPRFVAWTNDLAARFEDFINKAEADGRLEKWFEDGIQAAKDLGRVTGGIAEIFGAIDKAATKAGMGGLTQFADGVERLADFMQSPRVQNSMTILFQGALNLVDGLVRGIKGIGPAIEGFVPIVATVMTQFGGIFETALGMFGRFIDNNELKLGIVNFVGGIQKALDNLKPSIDPVSTSLGNLLSFMGQILDMGTRLLNNVLVNLGPKFDVIMDALKPFLGPIEEIANTAIGVVGTILDGLGKNILPPLKDLFVNLKDPIKDVLEQFKPEVANTLKLTGDGLKGLGEAAKILGDGLKELKDGGNLEWLGTTLKSIETILQGPEEGRTLFDKFIPGAGFGRFLAKEWEKLFTDWNKNIEEFKRKFKEAWDGFWSWLGKLFTGQLGGGSTSTNSTGTAFGGRGIGKVIGVEPTDTSFFETLKSTISTQMPLVGATITTAAAGIKVGWDAFWATMNVNPATWETIKAGITTGLEGVKTTFSTGATPIQTTWDTAMNGLNLITNGKFGSINDTSRRGMYEIGSTIGGGQEQTNKEWSGRWSDAATELNSKWNGINTDIGVQAARMAPEVGGKMGQVQGQWGTSWAQVSAQLPGIWSTISTGISVGMSAARGTLAGFEGMARSVLSFDLSGSGSALMRSFAAGISAASGWVSGAVQAVIAAAKAFFPNSPAKTGPFSGKGYTPWSGRALVKDFAGGMMDNVKLVKAAANRVVDAAQIGNSAFYDLESPGVIVQKKHVTVNVQNPVAEPTSRTIEAGSSLIRMAGAL